MWFFNIVIASLMSALAGMFVSMSSSGALPSDRGGLRGSSLLRRVLKYSVHLSSCWGFPFISLTVVVCRCDLPDSCFMML